jgi:transcriptional regulator with XRE-family HTH domain
MIDRDRPMLRTAFIERRTRGPVLLGNAHLRRRRASRHAYSARAREPRCNRRDASDNRREPSGHGGEAAGQGRESRGGRPCRPVGSWADESARQICARSSMPVVQFRLQQLIDEKGTPQSALSRESGVSFTTISRMCRNVSGQVSLETLGRLARALGHDVAPGALIAFAPETRRQRRRWLVTSPTGLCLPATLGRHRIRTGLSLFEDTWTEVCLPARRLTGEPPHRRAAADAYGKDARDAWMSPSTWLLRAGTALPRARDSARQQPSDAGSPR